VRRSAVWLAIVALLVIVRLSIGLLTMTDPPPAHPMREPSPAYTGAVDAPEVSPAQP
jgi:hypothetical protein